MQNSLISTFIIFFISILITVAINKITDVIDEVILKRKEKQRIEKQKKDWDNNQIVRRKFLSKYTLPESVLCLKNGEKDARELAVNVLTDSRFLSYIRRTGSMEVSSFVVTANSYK